MLSFKGGVRVRRLTLAQTVLLNAALEARDELGYPQELHITSINDGRHGDGSRHFSDEAVDLRTTDNGISSRRRHDMGTTSRKEAFRARWEALAGAKFRVLFENEGTPNEHLHGQVRKGHSYP